ncbi:MAG: AAA family ATPase [Acidimicrobiales bacterium]
MLSQKGGTGKSHTVRSLAVAAILDGRKVAVIDADPQATVVAWGKRRKHNAPHVIALGSQTIASQIEALKGRGADLIVIDTPPHAQPIINMAAHASTACLIVTGAFLEELETVATVADIAKTLKRPSAIALNRVGRSHALTLARTALGTFGLPVCPVAMAQLVTQAYASAEGETANEREPGGKAAQEVTAVYEWLKKGELI